MAGSKDDITLACGSDLRALVEHAAEQSAAQLQSISRGSSSSVTVLVVPEGKEVVSLKQFLDEYLTAPERKKGTARLTTLDSLIEHIKRHKDDNSVVFAAESRQSPFITAVLDYNIAGPTGTPRFGEHRAKYDFPLSDEWKAWQSQNGKPMSQLDFAIFMEDRILDVMAPPMNLDQISGDQVTDRLTGGDFDERTPDEQLAYLSKLLGGRFASPSAMMELSRGLTIHAEEKLNQALSLSTGETTLSFVSEHRDTAGNKLNVPNLFLIGIPVFRFDDRYRIAVRLRYRPKGDTVMWFYELYRHDAVFDDAFRKACEKVQRETALPLFYGAQEASSS